MAMNRPALPVEVTRRERARAALAAAGIVVLLGTAVALVTAARGRPVADVVVNACGGAVAVGFALFGTVSVRRVRRAEIALAQERARALEALATSERHRAEAEALAAVGSRASRVAHDLSNPLAVVRANLEWLKAAADAGRLAADGAEAREVIRETGQAVERLASTVRELRATAEARALGVKAGQAGPASSAVGRERDGEHGGPSGE